MDKAEVRYLDGYRVILKPDYHRAMTNRVWEGYVYEHIFVVEETIGRHLTENEVVHHLDGDRSNNRYKNLLVMTRGEHTKLHMWLRKGAPGVERFKKDGYGEGDERVVKHYRAIKE
jgi:hypothetical protein